MAAGATRLLDAAAVRGFLAGLDGIRVEGRVAQVAGPVVEAESLPLRVGDLCRLYPEGGSAPLAAECVGFRGERALLAPMASVEGLGPGSRVEAICRPLEIPTGPGVIGRVLSPLGEPMDGRPLPPGCPRAPLQNRAPHPLRRRRIRSLFRTGLKAVDGPLACGTGQRVGIFSGSGVGKTTLLGQIARFGEADVNVLALVGERGREVRLFLEESLGADGLAKSVVVVGPSDAPAVLRIKAALTATRIAEDFRDRGMNVLFLMDSLSRMAYAQREIGLAAGEPPATRGYPPSVFGMMPALTERMGPSEHGSITAFFTVLMEADDFSDPVADLARSLLDGHILLSRRLASQGQLPAVDVLESVSRVMNEVVPADHQRAARRFRDILATYREAEDLVNVGAYARGSNPRIDKALELMPGAGDFLRQSPDHCAGIEETLAALTSITATWPDGSAA